MIWTSAAIAVSALLWAAAPGAATADTYVLSCYSDKNFNTKFAVDTSAGTIMHLTSEDLDNGQTYEVYEFEQIVYWEGGIVSTFGSGSYRIYNYRTFNLDRAIILSTGHYPDNDVDELTAYNQFFTCDRIEG